MSHQIVSLLLLVFVALVCLAQESHWEELDYLDAVSRGFSTKIENSITIQLSTSVLAKSGDNVTVSWHGVQKPTEDDWVAAFSPGNVATIPIRYKTAEQSKGYLTSGSGSLLFELVNQRAEYVIAFMRGSKAKATVAALSTPLTFKKGPQEPTGEHLSITQKSGEMKIVWNSAEVKSPTVKWGEVSGNLTQSLAAHSRTYTKAEMCGGRAKNEGWRNPGVFHIATMTNLKAGTKYHYMVGDTESNIWGDEQIMYTPHPESTNSHVLVWGDMGHHARDGSQEVNDQKGAVAVTKAISKEVSLGNVDLTLHIGDISYARGYSQLWDEFMNDVRPFTSKVPYMLAIGNHEMDFPHSGSYFKGNDSGGECGVPYDVRFPMVRSSEKLPDRLYYSFDIGYAHYIIIDTEHDFTKGSHQHNWIVKDLEGVNRKKTPW
jgi:hypothetical protein